MDENVSFMDASLQKFVPWQVFGDIWRCHKRTVEMDDLIDQGLWNGSDEIVSESGSFMGDGLSFLHLSLYLGGMVRAAYSVRGIERPIGQSVGDDLILLETRLAPALYFLDLLTKTGAKFSKINAISQDSAMFCESYVTKCHDLENYRDIVSFRNSIFKDLLFLDTIKGSALSGKSKVKTDGAKPFIGHARLVAKQVNWHPLTYCKERAKIILWSRNYLDSVRLSSNMASLPFALGGIELLIGTQITNASPRWKDIVRYYESILLQETPKFLAYYTLLQGIYRANPKGFEWSNDCQIIVNLLEGLDLFEIDNLEPWVGSANAEKPYNWKIRYLLTEHKLIPIRNLADILARREAFLKQWKGLVTKSFLTLYDKNAKRRGNATWAIIKSELDPLTRARTRRISEISDAFSLRLDGKFFRTDDPSLIDVFQGMPTLEIDFDPMVN
jgi:hypothetical protein